MDKEERKEELRQLREQLLAFRIGEANTLEHLIGAGNTIDDIQLLLAQTPDEYLTPAWRPTQRAAVAAWDFYQALEELDRALGITLGEEAAEEVAAEVEEPSAGEGTSLTALGLSNRVHNALCRSENFAEALGLVVMGPEGRKTWRDPFVEEVLGVLEDESRGKDFLYWKVRFFGPKSLAELKEKLQEWQEEK